MMESKNKIDDIFSDDNEWQSCVNSLEYQAIVTLDENLKVIHSNKTIELWGWQDITKVRGMHILSLIKPAIEHELDNGWIDEWCKLETKENVEWVSDNYKTGKTYRFSFFPKSNSDGYNHNVDFYAVMLITDISNQKKLNDQKTISTEYEHSYGKNDNDELIRLSAYRLHQLANRLIHSQSDERKRISRELHDGLGQILSALKYQVESEVIKSEESLQLRKSDAVLNDVLKNITFALCELRRISVDLRPSILEDLGLLMTLKWFVKEYNKVYTDLNVDLFIDLTELDIPDKNKSIIYRIVQEAMNNIAKHSNAKNLFIRLTQSKKGIILRIRDDGDGFDLAKIKGDEKSGLGLKTMEERAVNSGAKFTMDSSYLSGTVIQVLWNNN